MVNERFLLALSAPVAFVEVVAAQDGSLRGVAFDKDFDVPLAGARAQIVELALSVTSDEHGNFVFAKVAPGRYTLVVSKDGYLRSVRSDVMVTPGQLTEVRVELAGDFTDMEEFVVQEVLQLGVDTEGALLELRLDSAAFMDSISSELMSKAGASDASDALRLVPGASVSNGKSAVIRGLPDRYVSSQMNGVRLPSADEDKRAVELDQFPSEVISNLQVSKTFTPDQQGDASGGAVDVGLKGVPDEPAFVKWKFGTSWNSQVAGRSNFLTYDGGGVHAFGKTGRERSVQPLGEKWDGAVGVSRAEAPIDFEMSGALGGFFDIGNGWRAGGLVSVYYETDSSFFDDGKDNSLWALRLRDPLTPQFSQGSPSSGEFVTSLLDITQSTQSAQWGALGTFGVESKEHAIRLAWLRTEVAEDKVTLAEDTRGKQYYFPGHDPSIPTSPGSEQLLAAPYLRLQTLDYTERVTETLQLTGRHRLQLDGTGPLEAAELDWTLAHSKANRDQPDKRQFASAWLPVGTFIQYKPAAQFTLGNLQRIWKQIEEESDTASANLMLPFAAFNDLPGYVKVGVFYDHVDRRFDQDTFSNFNDPSFYSGQFNELDWSQHWLFENHPITASNADIDYDGKQEISASYAMLEVPLVAKLRFVGGVRFESTEISIVNQAEEDAVWVPPGQFGTAQLEPGDADVSFSQHDILPAFGLMYEALEGLTLRASYSETVARQTFKELTPIVQQEYLGGPIFLGNPELEMSSLRNYDFRADYVPYEGGLFSASVFRKDIDKPIEYVEKLATFAFTTAVNYPRGTLSGIELETRQGLEQLSPALKGLAVGANGTWIDAHVRLPDDEINGFITLHGVAPPSTRDMTNAPEYLYNLFLTCDIEASGTGFGVFYTVQGDTLIQGPGPSNSFFIPATYQTRFDTLNATFSQSLGRGVRLMFSAKNLTDAERREVYRSEFIGEDVTRRSHHDGIDFSLSIGGEIKF